MKNKCCEFGWPCSCKKIELGKMKTLLVELRCNCGHPVSARGGVEAVTALHEHRAQSGCSCSA